MSTVLTVYSNRAFKKYLLPAINDSNYSVFLSANMFDLEQDLNLNLEIIDQKWYFLPSIYYTLLSENEYLPCYGRPVKDGDLIRLCIDSENVITIMVQQTDKYFSVYKKYLYQSGTVVAVGNVKECDICFESQYLEKLHARIHLKGEESWIEDCESVNGSFVNNLRVEGAIPLKFGDRIDIFGLRILFLGDKIAVNTNDDTVTVQSSALKAAVETEETCLELRGNSSSKIVHRSPRHIAKIDSSMIKIDEPPQQGDADTPSLFMSVAPSLSMALPMILGCMLMIYSSKTEGSGGGLYLYTGLITSVSSALIGAIWGTVNARQTKRKYIENEKKRNEKYRNYLLKKETAIKERYQKNARAMEERYKSADECCALRTDSTNLWNRNAKHPDFLTHRIGVGDVPFQVDVKIPEEKFTMAEDELAEFPGKIKNQYRMLHNVPVCVDLLKEQLIGIFGGKNKQGAVNVVLNLITQIISNNSYTDVKLVVIYDRKKSGVDETWNFVKWLPHVWNETRTFRYVASDKGEASEVFFELSKKIRMLSEDAASSRGKNEKSEPVKPYYVIVLENPDVLEGEVISKYILNPQPAYGFTTLYVVENYEDLPNECELVIENSENFQGIYRVTDDPEDRTAVVFDPVSPVHLAHLSENLANIEVRETESGGDVPNALTFFEMYGIQRLNELNVLERWKKNRTYESMKALIGAKSGGALCYLDVHEKYHGPHGLVAGTTGSGKSETLQTYLLSLAINFSPDDVGFFIIDYKGGGMGNLFNGLPHMIGQISNLSGNQIRRALISIKSEKDRRQRIFNEYSVNNINSYTKLYKNNEAKVPVPHLFIVIDEFAELKRDEPDFIQQLVSVSQVGRSLGIHLIMATQKPAGTVDDNIWSNSRFKLCLRVQDRQDSMDMLHRPDAAYILQAGRCFLQVGNDELFELFQSGWSGALYSEDEDILNTDIAKMLSVNGVAALEGNFAKTNKKHTKKIEWISSLMEIIRNASQISADMMQTGQEETELLLQKVFQILEERKVQYTDNAYNRKGMKNLLQLMQEGCMDAEQVIEKAEQYNCKLPERAEITQLSAVVNYLKEIAETNGYQHDFSLFLPLLPERICLDALLKSKGFSAQTDFGTDGWKEHTGDWSLAAEIGLYDDPENQSQNIYMIDFARMGHIAVCGALATGKSTFLQTMFYSLINRYSPDELQAYMIDFSAKMLSAFESAPHVGGIMYEEDTEKIAKFFTMIQRMLDNRKKQLKGGSFEQYIAVNGFASLPAIVILIDNYSAFLQKSGITEETENFLLQLSKEGVSYGIFLVVTAAGFGSGELLGKMADNFKTTICLEMNDAMTYTEIMRRMHMDVYPESDVRGRGIAEIGSRVLEFQTALAVDAESDYARLEEIRNVCEQMKQAWSGRSAKAIPEIPEKPVWTEFALLDDVKEMAESKKLLPCGYDAVCADIYGIDLSGIYTFTISGGKRKGKTNLLKVLALSAQQKGGRCILIDYSAGLERFAEENGMECISTEVAFYQFLASFQPEFEERNQKKHELLRQGLEEEEIFAAMQQYEKVFLFIDHLPNFIETAYSRKEDDMIGDYTELLEAIIEFGTLHNVYWFSCLNRMEVGNADTYRLYGFFMRDKKGIHLGGMTDDSPMNFEHLHYNIRGQIMPAGRGLLAADNEEKVSEVVVPYVKGMGK